MWSGQAAAGEGSTSTEALIAPWEELGWADDYAAWLDTYLTSPGPMRIKHARSWSLVGRVFADEGRHWFKQLGAPIAFEPALTEAVARRVPRFLPPVVAAEGTRLLTLHAGKRLDRSVAEDSVSPLWEHVVARYAELQIELVPFALDMPAPDARPEAIVARFGERAEPVVAALGDAVPVTLVHLSVSAKNVVMANGEPIFIDWAAGAIAHPFCGMAKTFRVLVRHHNARPGGPELERVRDAFLEPWTIYAPAPELRKVFDAAYALGALARAAAKERVLDSLPESTRAEYANGMAAQLEAFENALRTPAVLGA